MAMWTQLLERTDHLPDIVWNLMLVGASFITGWVIKLLLSFFLRLSVRSKAEFSLMRSILHHVGKAFNYLLPLLVLDMALPLLRVNPRFMPTLEKGTEIALILAFAALLVGAMKVLEDYVYHTYDLKKSNNLRERKIRTQLQFVRKLVIGLILIITACIILLSFDSMRKLGAGLLTGVGVGGIIIGFAAQKSLGNLLAGFQIAFTQPIRIDDVLVVEGEWGRVEEITLTYVVLNIWDQRKLILPINYFIEKPFQNWTRTGSEILGTAFFYLDYTIPVDKLRVEYTRLLEASPLWDRRVNVLQVTNITERTVEVRTLMSAVNSGQAFDLRCYIREQMLLFIRENYPQCFPRTRAMLEEKGEGTTD
ncbi:mechanosensitive ion channel family protein [Chitinophaga vietnamensis]|uniref:mechanosensitive ion channel family protein n=1 Tax=Chitinophaga vietnamensis TaxID=2593957 RepID=UPI001F1AC84D|nr:mechanosensitive ion channel domain-containing protein [Chitinophaga vietnamensis]